MNGTSLRSLFVIGLMISALNAPAKDGTNDLPVLQSKDRELSYQYKVLISR